MNYEKKAENWLKNCSDHRGEQVIALGKLIAAAVLEEVRWWDANADDLQMLWAESRKRIAALERAAGERAGDLRVES